MSGCERSFSTVFQSRPSSFSETNLWMALWQSVHSIVPRLISSRENRCLNQRFV